MEFTFGGGPFGKTRKKVVLNDELSFNDQKELLLTEFENDTIFHEFDPLPVWMGRIGDAAINMDVPCSTLKSKLIFFRAKAGSAPSTLPPPLPQQHSNLQTKHPDPQSENQQLKAHIDSLKTEPKHSYPRGGEIELTIRGGPGGLSSREKGIFDGGKPLAAQIAKINAIVEQGDVMSVYLLHTVKVGKPQPDPVDMNAPLSSIEATTFLLKEMPYGDTPPAAV